MAAHITAITENQDAREWSIPFGVGVVTVAVESFCLHATMTSLETYFCMGEGGNEFPLASPD